LPGLLRIRDGNTTSRRRNEGKELRGRCRSLVQDFPVPVDAGILEVLLVHRGGPFWARRGTARARFPKRECGVDEDTFEIATGEFREELE
jgi:hypothetical protein